MAFQLGPDPVDRADPPRRFRSADDGDIPPSPPACVLAEVDAAFEHAERLHRAGRELHFGLDGRTRRVVVQVRTLGGDVLRTLPLADALDFITPGAH